MLKYLIVFVIVLTLASCGIESETNSRNGNDSTYTSRNSEGYLDDIQKFDLATPDHPRVSPSGRYKMVVNTMDDDGTESWTIKIVNLSSNKTFDVPELFRIRDTIFIVWGEDDRAWVYSGDLGVFYWEESNGNWIMDAYVDGKENPSPPDAFVKLRPNMFTN